MLSPVLVTPPAADVVSLEEVKQHLHVDHDDDNTLLTSLLKAAVSHFDGWSGVLGRALVTQEWRQDADAFWNGWTAGVGYLFRLPLGPVRPAATVTVTYFDGSNVTQTLATSVYELRADALGPFLTLKSGQSWPSVYSRSDAVSVTYQAGYGQPEDVPEAIRLAIKMHVQKHYDSAADSERLQQVIDVLINPFRRLSI